MTLFEQVEASLPTTDILANTMARRRVLSKGGYIRKTAFRAPPAPIVKPEITSKDVFNHLDKILPPAPQKPITFVDEKGRDWLIIDTVGQLEKIKREVAEKHGITVADMESKRRHHCLMPARWEFCYRARTETIHSLPAIGHHLGGRDHTTILHGVRRHMEVMGLDK